MTVASTLTQRQYTGTGTSAQFSFPNKIFSAGDLVITIYDTSGNVYPFVNFANATLGWTYSVQNVDVDTGCIVVLSNVLTSGWVLDIRSLTPELQSTSVKNQGQFLPELHEEAFDRATRMIQDLLRLTYTFGIHGPDTEFTAWPALPGPTARRGYGLLFDVVSGLPTLGFLSAQNVTQGLIAPLLNAQTPQEATAGATIANFLIPSHAVSGIINPERYAVNTVPGTTDMGPAWNTAIAVALVTSGSGKLGCPIRWVGAHSIATPLAWGALGVNIVPVEVAGYGIASQLICNTTAGSGPLFPLDTLNGWYLHDFLMCGNSVHKNDGIHAGNVSSTEAIEWRVERVISLMAGVGLKIQNTNTGWVDGFMHWPGNNPALIVPQTVTATDISHGIYGTGSFAHNVYLGKLNCPPNANYAPGMRGIKFDPPFSFGVTIIMPLVQTLSGNGTETGIEFNCSGSATGLTIQGAYHEGAIISLTSVSQSNISSATDGAVGGAIVLANGTRENKFSGCNVGVIDITDSTCYGNSIDCCGVRGPQAWSAAVPYVPGNYVSNGGVNYKCILASTNNAPPNATFWSVFSATGFNDATEGNNLSGQPTRILNSFLEGYGSGLPDLGNTWRKLLTITANVASPDTYNASWNVLRVQAATLTINTPLHPRNGQRLGFTIRNETVGAITVTWGGGFNSPPWTNPATGQKRSIEFMYDSDFAEWNFLWYSPADAPN